MISFIFYLIAILLVFLLAEITVKDFKQDKKRDED